MGSLHSIDLHLPIYFFSFLSSFRFVSFPFLSSHLSLYSIFLPLTTLILTSSPLSSNLLFSLLYSLSVFVCSSLFDSSLISIHLLPNIDLKILLFCSIFPAIFSQASISKTVDNIFNEHIEKVALSDSKKEERAKALSLATLSHSDDVVESDGGSGSGLSATVTSDSSSNSNSDRSSGRENSSNRDSNSKSSVSSTDYRSHSMSQDRETKERNYIDTPLIPALSDHDMSAILDKFNPTRFVTRTVLKGQQSVHCSSPSIVLLSCHVMSCYVMSCPCLQLPPCLLSYLPYLLPPSLPPSIPPFLPSSFLSSFHPSLTHSLAHILSPSLSLSTTHSLDLYLHQHTYSAVKIIASESDSFKELVGKLLQKVQYIHPSFLAEFLSKLHITVSCYKTSCDNYGKGSSSVIYLTFSSHLESLSITLSHYF